MSRNQTAKTEESVRVGQRTGVIRSVVPDFALLVALIILALLLGWPHFLNGLDPKDEGFLAYGATRVMAGQMPNRDFVSLQPPLSFYATALWFRCFGTSLTALRALGLVIYAVVPVLVFGITRQLVGRFPSILASLFPL